MLQIATRILSDYGKVLAQIEPGTLGLPESFLPHPKPAIREATRWALRHVGPGQPVIREALVRGYAYLQQFVSDAEFEILLAAQTTSGDGDPSANHAALQIINRIKLDMERALEEISAAP